MVERWKGCYCDSDDRQRNTLIPWSATHAANRNTSIKHKFYGRAPWDGYFKTMSKVQTLKNPLSEYSGSGPNLSLRVLWLRTKSLSQSTLAQAQNPLPEYSGLHPKLSSRVLWLRTKSLSQSTLGSGKDLLPEYTGLGPNPSPRVLWLRIKTCCQSTLAQAKDLLPEYSGTGPNPSPRVLWQKVLWDRLKSLSQSTLGGGYEPLPEYSGRALQSEDYHLGYSRELGSSITRIIMTIPHYHSRCHYYHFTRLPWRHE